jgi:hypothetical protein
VGRQLGSAMVTHSRRVTRDRRCDLATGPATVDRSALARCLIGNVVGYLSPVEFERKVGLA